MELKQIFRLCGFCLILGGILNAVLMLLHPNDVDDPNALFIPP